jgi:hypothetical protein
MSKFAKFQLRIWNVLVTHCEAWEVKMWKKCIKPSMRLARCSIQCMLMHFNCGFKHVADCWKICALSAEWLPVIKLTYIRTCKIVPRKDRRFLCKVFLFLKMKIQLEGWRFKYITEFHAELQALIDSTMLRKFRRFFWQRERHWAWY